MSAIHTKSLTGITSITTPPGVDNVFTVHSNDTTERFRVDLNGNQSIAGILTVSQDLDVDGHTNLDNVSVAGVTTFSDNDIFFKNSGITSCKFDSDLGRFYFNHSGGLSWYKNGNLSNPSGATIFYSEFSNQYKGLVIQAPWQGQTNAKNVTVMGSSNGRFYVQNNLNASETFSAYFEGGVHLGYYQSGTKLSTTTKGITVGTGVTIETNGQATYSGIVTATSFKLSDGSNVGGVDSDAQENTVAGTSAGASFNGTDAEDNTLFGYRAGASITSGDENTFLGHEAGYYNSTASYNTAIGSGAGKSKTTGHSNVNIGYVSDTAHNASFNTSVGAYALENSPSNGNTAMGQSVFRSLGLGAENNTGLGRLAGQYVTTGAENTILGAFAARIGPSNSGNLTTGSNNIIIGYNAQASTGTISNEITLGNTSITKFRIPGINVTLKDNGGTPTQGHVLTVDGNGEASFSDQTFNDNNIVNDISALALKVSALENSAASNTNSTYVDSFQDSNGIASFTNTTRNTSGDFISSVSPKSFYKPSNDLWTFVQSATNLATNGACTFAAWMKSANGSNWTYNGSQGGGIMNFQTKDDTSKYLVYNIGYGSNNGKFGAHTPGVSDCNTTNAWSAPANKWVLGVVRTGYNWSTGHVEIMHRAYDAGNFTTDADSNGGTSNYGTLASGAGKLFKHNSNSYTGDYDNTYIAHMGFWNVSLNGNQLDSLFNNGKPFDWTQNSGNYNVASNLQEYFKMDEGSGTTLTNSGNGGNATKSSGSGSWDTDTQQIGSANATGNFISNTITASSSTNKMGVVITYTDTTGTATLNTDLKVSLSANNGSNYTQVTLVAQPNFATGVKMALANDVTVTAGTQLKYKVEFANQASGSKVTRVTGISLQY